MRNWKVQKSAQVIENKRQISRWVWRYDQVEGWKGARLAGEILEVWQGKEIRLNVAMSER